MAPIYISAVVVCVLFVLVAHYRSRPFAFYTGTGRYGALVSAASIVAAFTGGSALINTTGLAAAYGHWAFFDVLPSVIGLLLSAFLVMIGFFGKRFSSAFFDVGTYDRTAVAIHYAQICFLYTLVIAAQFRAVATVATEIQVAPWLAVLLCCVTVAAYAFRGFDAVTRTDIVQLLLMLPMYVIIAYIAAGPAPPATSLLPQTDMPLGLAAALCLPLVFLPISQEIHQRGAAVPGDSTARNSYWLAACIYFVLASTLVFAFAANPGLRLAAIISGDNRVGAVIVIVGVLSAILSTLDTATNVAAHAAQKLRPAARVPSWLVQALLLSIGSLIYLVFPTVLTLILFALFVYIAGPAFTFVAVYLGLHPRSAGWVGVVFAGLQSFVQLKVVNRPSFATVRDLLPTEDPIHLGLTLLGAQAVVLLALAAIRRLR